jgi:hypothetical protein
MVVPLTVIASPLAKPVESEAEPAAPDSAVVPLIATGVVSWSNEAAPVTEPEVETRNGGWGALMVVLPPLVVAVPAACEKPNAASAFCALDDDAEIEKLEASGALMVTAPPSTDDGVVAPVIESIADSRLPTVPDAVLMT